MREGGRHEPTKCGTRDRSPRNRRAVAGAVHARSKIRAARPGAEGNGPESDGAVVARLPRSERAGALRTSHRCAAAEGRSGRGTEMKRRFLALVLAAGALGPAPSRADEHAITLGEAVRLAIQKNEDFVGARESVNAARGTLKSANGAYDPVLYGDGTWQRIKQPTNSSIPGATLAPENESSEGGLELRQYLPTGGTLSVKGRGGRETDQGFVLLSPAYLTRVGAEFRQPLLRNRSIDPARRDIKVAKSGRDAAEASLHQVTTETLAAVERAYWSLVDARLDVGVRERAVELAQQQLTETQNRVDTGSVPRTELSQPRAELERRRGELLESTEAR